MIKAVCQVGGQRIVLLGLTGENITRITAGEPIAFSGDVLGIGLIDTTISICYGREPRDIADQMTDSGLLDRVMATPLDIEAPMQPLPTTDHIDVRQIVLDDIADDPAATHMYLTDAAFKLSIETVIGTLDRLLDYVAETGRHNPDELEALAYTMVRRLSGDRQERAENARRIGESAEAIRARPAAMFPAEPTAPPAVQVSVVLGVQDPTFHAPASPSGITGSGWRELTRALAESGFEILLGPMRFYPDPPRLLIPPPAWNPFDTDPRNHPQDPPQPG